ncbi:MAG: helix-turn-helix transcriptional regulator [Burkholderiales bacterium]|nr:helix-turn-helix transcriptional regulator [Burkholderiales bacterium]
MDRSSMAAGAAPLPVSFVFGRCRVDVARRELLLDGRVVKLGGRAFDVLLVLVEARGSLVAKDTLMARVWPGRIIEDNSLEAQISALRRALGAERELIRTVAGRGYQFVGTIADSMEVATPEVPAESPARIPVLPASLSPLIGRDRALDELMELTSASRLITLVGTGGIGKTRLALELARRLQRDFPDGVSLAELGPIAAAEFVPAAVADALGFPHGAGTASLDRIASTIRSRHILLILDNCEHLIDAAARVVEALLRAGAFTRVIATSREPLRAEGEYVYRVSSLDVPAEEDLDIDDMRQYGAMQLFDARIPGGVPGAADNDPQWIARSMAQKAWICRRLDGIPLAIELAAARVPVFGIQGVAERLDDRFQLLAGGSRTALPRQKTLRATLDWSHELLAADEREIWARLSVFAGAFTLESAVAVAGDSAFSPDTVVDCLSNLVDKSLVVTDASALMRHRLLETMRLYAREKLTAGSGCRHSCGDMRNTTGTCSSAPRSNGRRAPPSIDCRLRALSGRPARGTGMELPADGDSRSARRADDLQRFRCGGSCLLEECLERVDFALAHLRS